MMAGRHGDGNHAWDTLGVFASSDMLLDEETVGDRD